MLFKPRTESDELLIFRSLHTRTKLNDKERSYYLNLEKGYGGEQNFDQLAECLQEQRYILNDLLFEVNNSYFQIDTLIISQTCIHLIDVKNFHEDCYFDSDRLYSAESKTEYKNPLDQLKRSSTLFRQLLQHLKFNYLVDARIIFINPEFTLYQAPMDQPIILPTQVNQFLHNLNRTPSVLNEGHQRLARELLSLHKTKNPFARLPDYKYEQLQKGIYCKSCLSFLKSVKNNFFVCGKCGNTEKLQQAILRNTAEFKLLFPDYKITTPQIYEWCKVDLSRKTIYRTLKRNYLACGSKRHTYYEE